MSASEPVRFGVVGVGRIVQNRIAPALRASTRAELFAAASRDRGRAALLEPAHAFAAYDEVLEHPDVEAVFIGTHNGLHHEQAKRALENGKHVLCEKPLGRNADECQDLVETAARCRRHLVEAFMYRFHPQIRRAKELVDAGAVGKPLRLETRFHFKLEKLDDVRLNKDWGGGALLDVGCYCVNLSRLLLGDEPLKVEAKARIHPEHDVDMELDGRLYYESGTEAVFSCGFERPFEQWAHLRGDAGTLTLRRPFLNLVHEGPPWKRFLKRLGGGPDLLLRQGSTRKPERFGPIDAYQAELDDLAQAIRADTDPTLPPTEGLANARILDRLAKAARER